MVGSSKAGAGVQTRTTCGPRSEYRCASADGSSVLVHTLIENNLVDEYNLHVYPLVLGNGKKLFPDGLRVNLRLIESTPLPSGVVFLRYVPA